MIIRYNKRFISLLNKKGVTNDQEIVSFAANNTAQCKAVDFILAQRILVIDDCFFFDKYKPFGYSDVFMDKTGNEMFHNKIHISDFETSKKPIELFYCGLTAAFTLSVKLQTLNQGFFSTILSYNNMQCTLGFHKVRIGEEWLAKDLEGYTLEAVLQIID